MPITATILRINEDLMENALIANRDPEKTGWFVEIEVDNKTDSEALLSKQQYEDHCAGLSDD